LLVYCCPLVLSIVALAQSAPAAPASVRCAITIPRTTEADQALTSGKFAQAEPMFSAEVAKNATAPAYAGLVRTQLGEHKITDALASAKKAVGAFPTSAEAQTILGEALLRNSQVLEASAAFSKATTLDHCFARAHFGAGQLLNLASMRASAARELTVAHQLSPGDEEIRIAWLQSLAPAQRIPALREFLADAKTLDAAHRQTFASNLALLEKGATCHLATPVEKTKLDLMPLLYDGTHVRDWGLNARFNNRKTTLLELDTSVTGIVLTRDFASKAGLENILGPQSSEQASFMSYAESIKIGNLEFKDCPVRVVEDSALANGNSLISADIFKDHLITINFANRTVNLDPLPKMPEVAGATTGAPQDRYAAPEMKDWTRVYVADDRILVPTGINDSGPFLFMLDTGTIFTALAPDVSRTVLGVSADATAPIRGVSGNIVKVYYKEGGADLYNALVFGPSGERVKVSRPEKSAIFHFGPYTLLDNKGYAFDMTPLSSSVGLEVSGLLGFPIMKDFGVALDYRDGLIQFIFDKQHVYRTREGSYY
jgi:Flp pilus assembly protein TadD